MRRTAVLLLALAACDPDLTVPPKADAGGGALDSGAGGGDGGGGGGGGDAADLDAASGDDAGDGGGTVTEAATPKHVIDGTNDFTASEKFPTTSTTPNLFEGYFTWDDTRLYFGMSGADVGSNNGKYWVIVYLDGAGAGTTTGQTYGTQTPTLPFAAGYHLRWKADKSYTNAQHWNGTSWEDATVTVPITAAQSGNFMEMSIARSSIGSPSKVKMVMAMLVEQTGQDWTYAGVPSTTFVDGPNKSFSKYFEFDLASTKAPSTYTPLP